MQGQYQQQPGQFTNVAYNPNMQAQQNSFGGMNQQPGFMQPAPNAFAQTQPQQFQQNQMAPNQQFGYPQTQPQYAAPGQQPGMVQPQQYITQGNPQGGAYNYPDQSQNPQQGYQPPIQEIQKNQEQAKPPQKKGFINNLKNFWSKATD
jgi:hypothetical protein